MQAFSWSHIVPSEEYSLSVVDSSAAPFDLSLSMPARFRQNRVITATLRAGKEGGKCVLPAIPIEVVAGQQ